MSVNAVFHGFILGNDYVLLALAITLLYKHSKYIPLWIPEIGTLAAYSAYMSERCFEFPWLLNICFAITVVSIVGLCLHKWLLSPMVEDEDIYSGLLVSLGIAIVITNIVAFFSSSFSLTYIKPAINWSKYISPPFDDTLYAHDIITFVLAIIFAIGLWLFLSFTLRGKRIRAVMSNRVFAEDIGISVVKVDFYIIIFACILAGLAGIMNGMKFDLKPEMMFNHGLKALGIAITCGAGNIILVVFGAYGLGLFEGLVRQIPLFSPFSDALIFIVMLIALLIRYTRKT